MNFLIDGRERKRSCLSSIGKYCRSSNNQIEYSNIIIQTIFSEFICSSQTINLNNRSSISIKRNSSFHSTRNSTKNWNTSTISNLFIILSEIISSFTFDEGVWIKSVNVWRINVFISWWLATCVLNFDDRGVYLIQKWNNSWMN